MRHAPFYGWIKDLSAPDLTWCSTFRADPLGPSQLLVVGLFSCSAPGLVMG
jgi:hypothetical protein